MTTRVLTWNLERSKPESPRGAAATDYLFSQEPDVMVITEARTTFPERGGHTLWCEPLLDAHFGKDERKVLIWSKEPWTDIDSVGAEGLDQTRYIAASTETPDGPLTVMGVCIPWHMAEVVYRTGEKRKPWELHLEYLAVLSQMLRDAGGPLVVAGDFNQQVPRQKYGHRAAAEALESTFEPMDIATAGQLEGCQKVGIDHIAISNDLRAERVSGWPNVIDGKRLSDHDGAGVDIGQR